MYHVARPRVGYFLLLVDLHLRIFRNCISIFFPYFFVPLTSRLEAAGQTHQARAVHPL